MAHSFICSYFHCVWSTCERRALIRGELRERLWPYMAAIARDDGMKALQVGGTDNHVHVLLSLPATAPIAKAVQVLKSNSSKWARETLPQYSMFGWQEGYAAFSVSASAVPQVDQYIQRQEEHHRGRTFEEEFRAMLDKHGVAYDPRYMFG
jgi:REP element-mobilizing transposase RayT